MYCSIFGLFNAQNSSPRIHYFCMLRIISHNTSLYVLFTEHTENRITFPPNEIKPLLLLYILILCWIFGEKRISQTNFGLKDATLQYDRKIFPTCSSIYFQCFYSHKLEYDDYISQNDNDIILYSWITFLYDIKCGCSVSFSLYSPLYHILSYIIVIKWSFSHIWPCRIYL